MGAIYLISLNRYKDCMYILKIIINQSIQLQIKIKKSISKKQIKGYGSESLNVSVIKSIIIKQCVLAK